MLGSDVQPNCKPVADRLKDEKARNALAVFLKEVLSFRRGASMLKTRKVFFSYAWDSPDNPAFRNLQHFLRLMKQHCDDVGLKSFLDLFSMAGHIEGRMREGILESDLIILMGTRVYAQKTKKSSTANVRKELDYILEKVQSLRALDCSADCIVYPLALEGTFNQIFPDLENAHMSLNIAWINLQNGQYQMQEYIKFLTNLEPPGLLPLGFRFDCGDYSGRGFQQAYTSALTVLMARINKIYETEALIADPAFKMPVKKKSTVLSSAQELFETGKSHEQSRNFTSAYECYKSASAQGHMKATTSLGMFFLQGLGGVPIDKKKAYTCFLSAAESGHGRALYNLGRMLEYGDGVAQNLPAALDCYEKSFAAGNAWALEKCEKLRPLVPQSRGYQHDSDDFVTQVGRLKFK